MVIALSGASQLKHGDRARRKVQFYRITLPCALRRLRREGLRPQPLREDPWSVSAARSGGGPEPSCFLG